jgi:hypothetical protein
VATVGVAAGIFALDRSKQNYLKIKIGRLSEDQGHEIAHRATLGMAAHPGNRERAEWLRH